MILPLNLVEEGFEYVVNLRDENPVLYYGDNPHMNAFMAYFANFWMPIPMRPRWNVYSLADHRTNNHMEGDIYN